MRLQPGIVICDVFKDLRICLVAPSVIPSRWGSVPQISTRFGEHFEAGERDGKSKGKEERKKRDGKDERKHRVK